EGDSVRTAQDPDNTDATDDRGDRSRQQGQANAVQVAANQIEVLGKGNGQSDGRRAEQKVYELGPREICAVWRVRCEHNDPWRSQELTRLCSSELTHLGDGIGGRAVAIEADGGGIVRAEALRLY